MFFSCRRNIITHAFCTAVHRDIISVYARHDVYNRRAPHVWVARSAAVACRDGRRWIYRIKGTSAIIYYYYDVRIQVRGPVER